jgi:hypothetical protein
VLLTEAVHQPAEDTTSMNARLMKRWRHWTIRTLALKLPHMEQFFFAWQEQPKPSRASDADRAIQA